MGNIKTNLLLSHQFEILAKKKNKATILTYKIHFYLVINTIHSMGIILIDNVLSFFLLIN